MTRIVVDAMGSDDYPTPDVVGAVQAAREYGVEIILVGDRSKDRSHPRCPEPRGSSHPGCTCTRDADDGR